MQTFYAFSAMCFTFYFVRLASCAAPSLGMNCRESIKVVKKMEAVTVIRFWGNLIEKIQKIFLFNAVDSCGLEKICNFEVFTGSFWILKHIIISVVLWCLTILPGF